MADNTVLNAGSGGDTIATDDVSGVKYQVVKLAVGADGAANLVANANPIPVSDAGGSITVDGTVAVTGVATAAKQDTAQTSLDAIAASVAGTLTVGSHAVTESGAALTSLQLIDDTVYAEDVAAQAADKGIAILAVRRDADTSLVGSDNDYANLQVNAAGSLKVAITAGAGSGGTSIADGASFTRDTTSITPAGAAVESSAPTLTNGDVAALSMTTAGALRVAVAAGGVAAAVEDAASAGGEEGVMMLAVRRDTAASSSGTDGDFSTLNTDANGRLHVITGPSTGTIEVVGDVAHDAVAAGNPVLVAGYASAAAPSDVSADADAVRSWHLRNGAQATVITAAGALIGGDAANGLDVDITRLPASTNTLEVVGDVADDAAAAGNPVLIAGNAVETDGTDPTTVSAEGDAAFLRTDRSRRLLVSDVHPRGLYVSADYGSAQTNASVISAPGANLSLYITDIVISNGATAGKITLLDGSGGTVKFTLYPAINGGCVAQLKQPIRLTANTALCITSTTVTTHAVNIGYHIAP